MQQSVIYQEWKKEFLQEGRQKGAFEEAQLLALRLLNRRIGTIPAQAKATSARCHSLILKNEGKHGLILRYSLI
jgi:predicted transposase YdaD